MMDLIGAFFFSSVIIVGLKKDLPPQQQNNHSTLVNLTLKSIAVAAPLLALTYIGFSYLAAVHSYSLLGVNEDQLITQISSTVLGEHGGIVVSIAVALACLTTAVALAAVFAEFLHEDITLYKAGYGVSLIATLLVTFFISTLEFTAIKNLLGPILEVCYPALIALTVLNIMNKLWGWKFIKTPVFLIFVISLISKFINN